MRTVDLADDEQARVGLAADWHVCLKRASSAVSRPGESLESGDNLSASSSQPCSTIVCP